MSIIEKNAYEIYCTEYLIALVNGCITDEMRNNVLSAEGRGCFGYGDLFAQVCVAYTQLVIDRNYTAEQVLEGIHTEFEALNMADTMGEFSQYEDIIIKCANTMAAGGACLNSCYALADGLENQPDVVRYGAGVAILRHIALARKTVTNLDLATMVMNVVKSYETEPDGAEAIKCMAELVINNKQPQEYQE